jgi:predicted ATPase
VTSRTPLRVSGEREYAVAPMEVPDPRHMPSLEGLPRYGSIELFVQRARQTMPDFELTPDNAAAVADICYRLDGLPLAIELAAARMRILPPQEIVKRLDARLTFLTTRVRDVPERQRTLRNAIGWSYDLLDDEHRALFRRLGVFVAGFDLEAAEHVADATHDLGLDALDAIELLLDNSLVRRYETDAGSTRFRMLRTIREYALDRLEDAGERPATVRRFTGRYLRFVEDQAPGFTSGPEALVFVDVEHDNIRSALRWAIDEGDAATAMRIGASMWRYWQLRGHLAEAWRWLTEIVGMDAPADATRARAVMALGSITYWQNDFEETRRHYETALDILRSVGDEAGLQEALYNAGFLSLLEGDPVTATDVFLESRALAERLGDRKGMADTAWALAMAAISARRWDDARRWGEECTRLYDEVDDLFGKGLAQFVFFQIARYTGDAVEARRQILMYTEQAIRHDATIASASLEMLAEADLLAGEYERAVRLRGAAEASREIYGGGSPPPLLDLSDVRAAAGAALGDERIEELWQEGRSMPPEDALAYALKEFDVDASWGPDRVTSER